MRFSLRGMAHSTRRCCVCFKILGLERRSSVGAVVRPILVVDDDGDVRDVITDMLVTNRFVATVAAGGAMREVFGRRRHPY
jgi:hypothetical protein